MKMNSQLSYKLLLSTTFIGTVTAGLFWTGFPVYLTSLPYKELWGQRFGALEVVVQELKQKKGIK
jgi:hypothetical protein